MPGYKTCNFIKKETLALVLYCEFCEISKNTFYYRTPLVATYVLQITFDPIFLEKHSMKMFLSFENIKSNLAEKELSILSYLSADAFSTIIWKNSLFKNWWEQRVLSSSVCCFYLQKMFGESFITYEHKHMDLLDHGLSRSHEHDLIFTQGLFHQSPTSSL